MPSKFDARRRVFKRIDEAMDSPNVAPGSVERRERAKAASAYAWLAALEDKHFEQHRRDGILSQFMLSFLYRLWPLDWPAKALQIDNRRACMERAVALLMVELQELEIERMKSIDYDPEEDSFHH